MTATNLSGLAFIVFFLAIIILPFCVWIYALLQIYKRKTNKYRWLIFAMVFFTYAVGAVIYLIIGNSAD